MTIGPFLFAAPLALLGLIALPVIWWLMRATPPAPKRASLPSLRLLDGLDPKEETPSTTPWWIRVLRLAAICLAILGLAQPIYAPDLPETSGEGPVLIVVDDGWTSAERFSAIVDAAAGHLTTLDPDRGLHLLTTAPNARPIQLEKRYDRQGLTEQIRALEPYPWPVDRAAALEQLEASGLQPDSIFWASDGLDATSGEAFAEALAGLGELTVFAAPPRGPIAITGLETDASGVALSLSRVNLDAQGERFVSALAENGSSLASAPIIFEPGELTGTATFGLPPATLSRINRFRVIGAGGAGSNWLWDSTNRRPLIGLVTDAESVQPLLSDVHYIRRALQPYAVIEEGTLTDMIALNPDVIIVTDIGIIPEPDGIELQPWLTGGGTLIRFAGPLLANARSDGEIDPFLPVRLRRASRSLGGALAWETPQKLAAFPESSPFVGLAPPDDARIREQVLASPSPELDRRTWARLEDGSPLVTAETRDEGAVILFHITAGPDWSDLPYTGTFVDMLRRAMIAGRGRQQAADPSGLYAPALMLSGFGQLTAPSDTQQPVAYANLLTASASLETPPGYYDGPGGRLSVNVGKGYTPDPIVNWPAAATLLGDVSVIRFPLSGQLISLSLLLVLIDVFVALMTSGKLSIGRRKVAAAVLLGGALLGGSAVLPLELAHAQPFAPLEDADEAEDDLAILGALDLRFAYTSTGDASLDDVVKSGLDGLSRSLYLRTSVEPAEPVMVDLETDPLELFPFIYMAIAEDPVPLSPLAGQRLNAYMRGGGAVLIDTRRGGDRNSQLPDLRQMLTGVDLPALNLAPDDHVIRRTFFLLDEFPGRYSNDRLWLQTNAGGDGVSSLFVGDADWAGAWAIDDRGRFVKSVDGGNQQREMAFRFGINFVMYVLTGNYKADQVHLDTLLQRLGEDEYRERDLPIQRDPLGDAP